MEQFFTAVSAGLGQGSIYALLALGFVIIYKSMGVISFAQPAFMLSGAILVSYLSPDIGFPAAVVVEHARHRARGPGRGAVRDPADGRQGGVRHRDHHHRRRHRGAGRSPVRSSGSTRGRSVTRGAWTPGRSAASTSRTAMSRRSWRRRSSWPRCSRSSASRRSASRCGPRRSTRRPRWRRASTSAPSSRVSWALAGGLAAVGRVLRGRGRQPSTRTSGSSRSRRCPVIILGGLDSLGGAVLGGLIIGVAQEVVTEPTTATCCRTSTPTSARSRRTS